LNLSLKLHDICTNNHNKTAIVEKGEDITYRQLWERIEALANALLRLGIKEGERVAIILPNCQEYVYSLFAVWALNAIAVPLKMQFTLYELNQFFHNCQPRAVILTDELANQMLKENPRLIEGKELILLRTKDHKSFLQALLCFSHIWTLQHKPLEIKDKENQTATINYSYMGFGYPLGVCLSQENLWAGLSRGIYFTESNQDSRILCALPIFHILSLTGCILVPLFTPAAIILTNDTIPAHLFRTIIDYEANFIFGVPTLYLSLLHSYNPKIYQMHTLKAGITGASLMSAELQQEIKDKMGIELKQGYGLTECMPVTCNMLSANVFGSLGPPGADVEIRIVDASAKDLASGDVGEILIRCHSNMQGYFHQEEETKRVLKEGWLYTGDLGFLDDKGYLYFAGLKKKIAKVGGNTVDLQEVQKVMLRMIGAEKVFIEKTANKLWGETLSSQITSQDELTVPQVRAFCRQKLALYKLPKSVIISPCTQMIADKKLTDDRR
jgi:long-chain acyl-CoA synthetase